MNNKYIYVIVNPCVHDFYTKNFSERTHQNTNNVVYDNSNRYFMILNQI